MILFFAVLSLISIFAFDYTCNKDCDKDCDEDVDMDLANCWCSIWVISFFFSICSLIYHTVVYFL